MSWQEVRAAIPILSVAVSLLTFINSLAFCELHLALAAVALRVMPHMQLCGTTAEDVAYDHDMFVPVAKEGSRGVNVIIE